MVHLMGVGWQLPRGVPGQDRMATKATDGAQLLAALQLQQRVVAVFSLVQEVHGMQEKMSMHRLCEETTQST